MARGIANYVETPAARRMRSLLRLPRRAFIGSLRYGEGRLYTKNAGTRSDSSNGTVRALRCCLNLNASVATRSV
jgi:hypothetical protein